MEEEADNEATIRMAHKAWWDIRKMGPDNTFEENAASAKDIKIGL